MTNKDDGPTGPGGRYGFSGATAYQAQVGDRVRIVLEGAVAQISNGGQNLKIVDPDFHRAWIADVYHSEYTVEKLEAPEPTWERGDVAVCPCGDPFIFGRDERWRNPEGGTIKAPHPPLTLLVRDGETVAADKK